MIEHPVRGTILPERLVREAAVHAGETEAPVLVSCTERVAVTSPLDLFHRAGTIGLESVYWEQPRDGTALVGVGVAVALEADGEDRFERVSLAWRRLLDTALIDSPPHPEQDLPPAAGPVLLGGFSFDAARAASGLWDGFPAGRLVLPRFLLTVANDACWLTANLVVQPGANTDTESAGMAELFQSLQACENCSTEEQPDPAVVLDAELRTGREWMSVVEDATRLIQSGAAEKVVLARAVCEVGTGPFVPTRILDRLRGSYPGCTVFAFNRGDTCFLGATPEPLVQLRGSHVETSAVAGTAPRGEAEEDDCRLGRELLASEKNLAEHRIVVRTLVEQLSSSCPDLQVHPEPVLLRLPHVQHLMTPVHGTVVTGEGILDLVARLHPTPAMCGFPREEAMRFIREREQLDRGWYAGPIGWVDARGDGEFAVAIRSALLRDDEATVFAGCGIMADSEPEAEYEESRLKLRAMLSRLGHAVQ